MARISLYYLARVLLPTPTISLRLILADNFHLQLSKTFFLGVDGDTNVDHLPDTSLPLHRSQGAGSLGVGLPSGVCLVLEVPQPLEAVALREEVDVDLTLPVVEVSEAERLYEVRDGGQQAPEIFVMIKIENS